MIITTQLTKDYYDKAKPLFESIKQYWHGRFVLGCIGFTPDDYDGEFFTVEISDIKSYMNDWPKNRPFYVSMQAGEFVDWIDCGEEEIIICIDADTIMQREFSTSELMLIRDKLQSYDILSVHGAWPPTPLTDALNNIGGNIPSVSQYKHDVEFTASFMAAKKSFFRTLSHEYIIELKNRRWMSGHHAFTQWMINVICTKASVFYLPPYFQCGDWYSGFNTSGKPLQVNGQIVLFNHTKFN